MRSHLANSLRAQNWQQTMLSSTIAKINFAFILYFINNLYIFPRNHYSKCCVFSLPSTLLLAGQAQR